MKKSTMRQALTAVVLAGAAVLATVAPASADVRPTRPCAGSELSVEIAEGYSPSPDTSRLFMIFLKGHDGVSCLLSGALDYIRFYDTSGRPLDVRFSDKYAVAPFEQVWVDDYRRAAVYIWTSVGSSGLPIGSMAFSVPTTPEVEMTAPWPSPVDGPLRIMKIMAPVS
ncbi:hypothetical protein [Umezawaea sp. Da 62-37]|uniref:hypothetical protein n=1 Tax=Umezawaea sp. Da 62-37 TaxID=3075927 RepID=UPI0028F72268|nr:hypothetical protein [Umezawaea sp. Da 62-37]WNV87719.1 hypothetical protein RM788_05360 [Umezawaea sp. Da 62-37]